MPRTLFRNGRWLALPGAQGPMEGWLLADRGRILALGPRGTEPKTADSEIDLSGRAVVPGPVDAHCHLVSYGMYHQREADLRGAASLGEIADRLRRHAEAPGIPPAGGRWRLGRGFDQELLAGGLWPTRRDLDRISPEAPLRITRICGHALVANTAALRLAGVDPEGCEPGLPEGVVTEERMSSIWRVIPEPSEAEWLAAARWGCHEAARVGFVGAHSLMAHTQEIRALVALAQEGPLPVRVLMQYPYALLDKAAASGLLTGFGDEYLAVGAIKLFSDGSLGARTAALLEPYSDAPDLSGELIYPPAELAQRVRRIFSAGFQVCVHAIGDRAMEVTLDAFEASAEVRAGHPSARRFPPRIEHASLVNERIIRRMRRLGVAAAVQPQFARSDSWAPQRLGDRAAGCYAFRSLYEAGIPLAGSTDCPVEPLDAMAAIGQMVCRPDWSPDEGLPLTDVLRIFSEGSFALRGFPPGSGSLAPGQLADFVVLEQDPSTVPPAEIERIPVAMTVVGGAAQDR